MTTIEVDDSTVKLLKERIFVLEKINSEAYEKNRKLEDFIEKLVSILDSRFLIIDNVDRNKQAYQNILTKIKEYNKEND